MCPLQLDGAEWLHPGTIPKCLPIRILGDMPLPRAHKNNWINVGNISPSTKARNSTISAKEKFRKFSRGHNHQSERPPMLYKSWTYSAPPSIFIVFESPTSIKTFSSYLSANKPCKKLRGGGRKKGWMAVEVIYRAWTSSFPRTFWLCLNDRNRSNVCELFSAKQSAYRSVGYIQTCASTGLVVNHCVVAMSPNDNSRDIWHL